MTEAEWMECAEPEKMLLNLVLGSGSAEQMQVFVDACRWCVWPTGITDVSCRRVAAMAELYTIGVVSGLELHSAFCEAKVSQTTFRATGEMDGPLTHLLRCVFGNPFRPVSINLACQTPTVVSLAQAAYDNSILPPGKLEPARLAILADALEEAGCDNADILNHLREPGEHVRGCWVLDLLLGKE